MVQRIDGALEPMVNNIIIAGGGTGGHLFPALAIGEEINMRYPKIKIHYMGSCFGLEAKVFPVKDVWHTLIPIRGLQRDFSLRSLGRNILLPFRIIRSIIKVRAFFIEFNPEIIIGTGGYAAAIPLFIASMNKDKIQIILQEQNSYPGLTTRWFSKKADKIYTAFKGVDKNLNSENISLTGNPIRKNISNGNFGQGIDDFRLSKDSDIILVFGGSQGSKYLNILVNKITDQIEKSGVQIIWQTGDNDFIKYRGKSSKNIKILPFINNMADAYAISNLVISRSGALTIAEITSCGIPAILIPFLNAAGDHQTKNAEALVDAGAAEILNEKTVNHNSLFHSTMNLIHNKQKLKKMRMASKKIAYPKATKLIVDDIIKQADSK